MAMRVHRWFPTLYALARLGACRGAVRLSTTELARMLGCSQQTASRHLIALEREGLIRRETSARGCIVEITPEGRSRLEEIYRNLHSILREGRPLAITIEGEVFTGLGEGAYYVMRRGYRRQFVKKLGFDPYPGTLNLRLTAEKDLKARMELELLPAVRINGFMCEDRTFGEVRCYPALINEEVEGAIVVASRSHYGPSVLEVISPVYLRERFNLKDGDRVRVRVLPHRRVEKAPPKSPES